MFQRASRLALVSLLVASAAPIASSVPPDDPALLEQMRANIPLLEHALEGVTLTFVRVERLGLWEEGEGVPETSLEHLREYRFGRDGYILTSKALDPIVTPRMQLEGDVELWRGQDATVIFDGRVEMCHEDIPESDEDLVVIATEPLHLEEQDPRLFGLGSILFHEIERIEPRGDGRFLVGRPDGFQALINVDPSTMTCRDIEILGCNTAPIGSYAFGDFQRVELGAAERVLWYPTRSDLRKYESMGSKKLVYHVTYLLVSMAVEPGLDERKLLSDHEISPESRVVDGRFVPPAHYRAGKPGGALLAFPSIGASLLDRLQVANSVGHDHGLAGVVGEIPAGTGGGSGSSQTTNELFVAGMVLLLVSVMLKFGGGKRGAARESSGMPSGRGRELLLLFIAASIATDGHASERSEIAAEPASVIFSDVVAHVIYGGEVVLRSESTVPVPLRVETEDPFVVVWPRSINLVPGEDRSLSISVVLPREHESRSSAVLLYDHLGEVVLSVPVRFVGERLSSPVSAKHPAPTAARDLSVEPGPQLGADRWVHDFGEIIDSDSVTAEFPFHNAGSAPLKIRQIEKECGCTEAMTSSDIIPVGNSASLTAVLAPENRVGKLERGVLLVTNDPIEPISRFVLRAQVIPEITVDTDDVELGDMGQDEEVEVLLSLHFAKGVRRFLRVESDTLPMVDSAWIQTGDDSADLAVVLKAVGSNGKMKGALAIHFEGRQFPTRVAYGGDIVSPVFAEPSSLGFAFVHMEDPTRNSLEFAVISRFGESATGFDFDQDVITVERITEKSGEAARYRVRPVSGVRAGFFSTSVEVHMTGGDRSLEVPVRGFVGDTNS